MAAKFCWPIVNCVFHYKHLICQNSSHGNLDFPLLIVHCCSERSHYLNLTRPCRLVVKALNCGSGVFRSKSHQLPLDKKNLHLAPHPRPSKTANWGPCLGGGWTRPLAVPYSVQARVGLQVPTPWLEGVCQSSCEYLAHFQDFVQHWLRSYPK